MTRFVLFVFLFSSPFVYTSRAQNELSQNDDCDFSLYKPIRITDYKSPIRKKVVPDYPQGAKEAKVQGTIQVKVLIDQKGNVVMTCSTTGHPLLRDAAIQAALKWKFQRSCKSCLGRQIKYLVDWIIFNFNL
jgi:TonB family protein